MDMACGQSPGHPGLSVAIGDFDTRRCHVRALCGEDRAMYRALYTDPGTMAHVLPPLDVAAADRAFAVACRRNGESDGREWRWAVVDRRSSAPLGLLALSRDAEDSRSAEVGVMLLPHARRRGHARELLEALMNREFTFGTWGLGRIWARHRQANIAGAALLAACGFVPGSPAGGLEFAAITQAQWQAHRRTAAMATTR